MLGLSGWGGEASYHGMAVCGLVLLAAGERDETTVKVSTASKAVQTLTNKFPQETPSLPSPETA